MGYGIWCRWREHDNVVVVGELSSLDEMRWWGKEDSPCYFKAFFLLFPSTSTWCTYCRALGFYLNICHCHREKRRAKEEESMFKVVKCDGDWFSLSPSLFLRHRRHHLASLPEDDTLGSCCSIKIEFPTGCRGCSAWSINRFFDFSSSFFCAIIICFFRMQFPSWFTYDKTSTECACTMCKSRWNLCAILHVSAAHCYRGGGCCAVLCSLRPHLVSHSTHTQHTGTIYTDRVMWRERKRWQKETRIVLRSVLNYRSIKSIKFATHDKNMQVFWFWTVVVLLDIVRTRCVILTNNCWCELL